MRIRILNKSKTFEHGYNYEVYVLNTLVTYKNGMMLLKNVWLNDVMKLSDTLNLHESCDAALELNSFSLWNSTEKNRCFISGIYWNRIPVKYLPRYRMFKEQQCVEIADDIILISPFNNALRGCVENGKDIKIVPSGYWNLKCIFK